MNLRKTIYSIASIAMMFGTSVAMAAEGAVTGGDNSLLKFGATLALGIAAFGGAFGQGRAASAALEGIARNPAADGKIRTPMIIALALIESLVLYAFVIAFMAIGK